MGEARAAIKVNPQKAMTRLLPSIRCIQPPPPSPISAAPA